MLLAQTNFNKFDRGFTRNCDKLTKNFTSLVFICSQIFWLKLSVSSAVNGISEQKTDI